MNLRCDSQLWMRLLMTVGVAYCALGGATPSSAQSLRAPTGRLFIDSTNGYFSMIPPKGWRQEISNDARTKVTWRNPEQPDVLLRVIARAATEDFAEVKAGAERTSLNLRSRGTSVQMSEQEVAGRKAVFVQTPAPGGGKTRIVLFLIDRVHFNIQFAAPSTALYDRHLAEAMASLDTLSVLPGKQPNADKLRAEELSWYRRQTFLFEKLGDIEVSRALAAEGLKKFPGDAELIKRSGK